MSENRKVIRIGGRRSKLAVVQSELVKSQLEAAFPDKEFEITALETLGDKVLDKSLYSFGGKALWTKELEVLLLRDIEPYKQIDLIVHSLKDMPTILPEEFELGAISEREDPRDALVMKAGSTYKTLDDLPAGCVVGTSSIRRSAQLKITYPHLQFESVRGNVQTRLAKLDDPEGPFSCIILAAAGLVRLGLQGRITYCLEPPIMYHAVGQGALGIEIRKDDEEMKNMLRKIECINTTYCCLAERSLMRTLEGGCSVPIGVNTQYNDKEKTLKISGIVSSVDGTESVKETLAAVVESHADAEKLGKTLAAQLIELGAKRILDAINLEKLP